MILQKIKLVALMLIVSFIVSGQGQDTLDLTKAKANTTSTSTEIGGGTMGSSDSKGKSPSHLKLTLLELDKNSYQIGDTFVYEVSLENVSKQVIIIPWSSKKCNPNPSSGNSTLSAILSIVIKDDTFGDQFLGSQGIYGCNTVQSSVKKIRPGQKVKIRASGSWWLSDSRVYQKVIKTLPQKYSVRAAISIFDRNGNAINQSTFSTNGEIVELKKRQP